MSDTIYTQQTRHKILNPHRMTPDDPLNVSDPESDNLAWEQAKADYDRARDNEDIKKMIEARDRMVEVRKRIGRRLSQRKP
jgi:hypothetical protein